MRFLLGLAIGGGIGYVLGTRDGRERYDEIVASVSELIGEEKMSQMTEFLDQGAAEMRQAASEGTDAATDVVEAASEAADE